MFNRTPMIILTAASDSSSYNANVNVSMILMQDGLSVYNIPRRGDGAFDYSVRLVACGRLGHVFESQPQQT